jgi:DNA-binding XRE family transcriptional regulator
MTYKVDLISLKKIMIENGIKTQLELAEKSDISPKTINGIMNGKITPSVSIMYKLAACLQMDSKTAGETFFAQ